MTDFDSGTALLLAALLNFILPANTWMALVRHRNAAVILWCCGGLLTGLGLLLVAARGTIPDGLSYTVAWALLVLACLLRVQALRMDLGRPWRARWIVLATLLFALVYQGFYAGHYVFGRMAFTSGVLCLVMGLAAALAWEIARKERSTNAGVIAVAFALPSGVDLFLSLWMSAGFYVGSPMSQGQGLVVAILALQTMVICSSFSYVGLVLERSLIQQVQAAAQEARAEEGSLLGEQLMQLEQQRSLSAMSASLGHELNQPLAAVLTNAQVALRTLRSGRCDADRLSEFFDKIALNTKSISRIIESSRSFTRPAAVQLEPVCLDRQIAQAIELFDGDVRRSRVRILFSSQATPVWVLVDPVQLSQVLVNVLRNAVQATKGMDRREIRVDYARSAEMVLLTISDTGPGFSPEAIAQAGSPFFTTKADGLGMGLAISQTILSQFGCTLTLRNAQGAGAVVEIGVPLLVAASDQEVWAYV